MANDSKAPKANKNKLFTLLDTIYKRIYNLSTIMSEQPNLKRRNHRKHVYNQDGGCAMK